MPTICPTPSIQTIERMQKQIDALKADNDTLRVRLDALEAKLAMPVEPVNDLLDFTPSPNPFDLHVSTETDPRKLGFELEELIHNAVSALDSRYIVRREQDIRNHFNDQSLNGVDHWITKEKNHYMIQTKWRETTTQPEISQFLSCADRIQARFESNEKVRLIWVCKNPPTKHALTTLNERKVQIISCNLSIQALARNVVDFIASLSFADPTPAYKVIPIGIPSSEETQSPTFRVASVADVITPPASTKVLFDDTDDGKTLRTAMETFIQDQIINNIRRLINNTQYSNYHSNAVVVDTMFPKSLVEWANGSHKKINYNKILKQLKGDNYPSTKIHPELMYFAMYCKMRYISTLLAPIALEYNAKRSELIAKKSSWGKLIPELTCVAEPMTDDEYKSVVVNTRDYMRDKDAYTTREEYNAMHKLRSVYPGGGVFYNLDFTQKKQEIASYKPTCYNQFFMYYYVN
jgi:hypothetical protein